MKCLHCGQDLPDRRRKKMIKRRLVTFETSWGRVSFYTIRPKKVQKW